MELIKEYPKNKVDVVFDELNKCMLTKSLSDTYALGDELVLKQIYKLKDADIQAIVKDAFYAQILQNSYEDSEFWDSDSDDYLEPTDTEELYKTVKGYMSSDRKDFEIKSYRIYFYYNKLLQDL